MERGNADYTETCPCCMDVTDAGRMWRRNSNAHVCHQTQSEQVIILRIKHIFQTPDKIYYWVQQHALPTYFFTTSSSRVIAPITLLLPPNKSHHFQVPPCGILKLHIRGLLKSKFCLSRLTSNSYKNSRCYCDPSSSCAGEAYTQSHSP